MISTVPAERVAGGVIMKRAVTASSSSEKSSVAEAGATCHPAGASRRTAVGPPVVLLFCTVTRNSRGRPPAVSGTTPTSGATETDSTGTTFTIFCFSPELGVSIKKIASKRSARLNSGGSLLMSLQVPMKKTSEL